ARPGTPLLAAAADLPAHVPLPRQALLPAAPAARRGAGPARLRLRPHRPEPGRERRGAEAPPGARDRRAGGGRLHRPGRAPRALPESEAGCLAVPVHGRPTLPATNRRGSQPRLLPGGAAFGPPGPAP